MSTTNTNNALAKINEQLQRLDWMIADAKRDLKRAAEHMRRRGEAAVEECEALTNDQPCNLMWVEFAESDLRNARAAKAKLDHLVEQQQLLQYLVRTE